MATASDAALITTHRAKMFREMGRGDDALLAEMSRHFEPWVAERLGDGRYLGWIAEENGRAVAGAGLYLMDWPPHALDPASETRGYLLNVWVEPEFRGRGVAKALTRECMEECARRGIGVMTLHASDAGRPVYEGLGFAAGNEMIWRKA